MTRALRPSRSARLQRTLRFFWLLPRNVLIVALRGYRAIVSPLYGDVCRYYPSCSAYALGSVQQHGLFRGVVLSAWRVARCHPWAAGGVDDVRPRRELLPTTPFGFVSLGMNPISFTSAQSGSVAASSARLPVHSPHAHSNSHGKG